MFRRFYFILLGTILMLAASCRSTKEDIPSPERFAQLHEKPKLPRRGLPVSDFEHLAHWEVFSETGTVALEKDLSQVLWGRASARISFSPESPGAGKVVLKPAEPWVIQSQFDTILLWIRHDGAAGLRNDHRIRLIYRDAAGKSGEWILPYSPSPEMQMLHIRITEEIPTPVQVESLIWDVPATAAGVQNLYLDSLSIYQEVLSSIPQTVHYVRPFDYAPVFAPKRKNSVTLNFPTDPAAYRPQTYAGKSIQSLRRRGDTGYVFQYESNEMQLEYRIQPQPGMPAVEVAVNGKDYPRLWQGTGVSTEEGIPELRFARIHGDKLLFQYTQGLEFEFSLHGKTLQVDMNSLLENVRELNLGRISGVNGRLPQTLQLPMFRIREDLRWPVFLLKDEEKAFLVSCFPDWWSSLSSRYQAPRDFRSHQSLVLGKMLYESKWRGSRNMFRERIYFTVSDRLLEVLPSASMPVGLFRTETGKQKSLEPGISPAMNLMAIEPLEEAWQDRFLARDTEGDWREHPVKGYLIKSGLLDGYPMKRLSQFRAEYSGTLLNIPEVAMFPPWRYLDYDVRSVGGASFTQTFAEVGALLQQAEAEWGAGIISRGGAEWFWSGLVSAIAPEFPLGIQELHPLLPHFAWHNVHPASQILGLGPLKDFRLPSDQQAPGEEVLLNRLLALQVAYGAIDRVQEVGRADLKLKSERIQGLLQPHFADAKAVRIAYWSGDKFLDAGEAAAADVLWDSRLYIRLNSDTEIWVNGDLFQFWKVRVDGRDLNLPPFGFVVRGRDLLIVHLPEYENISGLTLLQSPGQTWVSSRGKEVSELSMRLKGSLQIRAEEDGAFQIDIDDWHGEAAISRDLLKIRQVGTLRGITSSGDPVEDLVLIPEGNEWILKSSSLLHRVWISPEISGSDLNFSP